MKIAKECVTTHLPNQLVPKMDRARSNFLYHANGMYSLCRVTRKLQVIFDVDWRRTVSSADLGGSSRYS